MYKVLFVFTMFVLMLLGCSGETTTQTTTSSGSSSSSGAFVCPTTSILIAPLNGDNGLPYFENRVHACRRFGPGVYKQARVGWRIEGICTEQLAFTWAVDNPDKRTGFDMSNHVFVPPDGIVRFTKNGIDQIVVNVSEGQSLFACVVLKVLDNTHRSCIEGCRFEGDPDSFWGNTGPDGNLINPFELELLASSPTAQEAQAWGNDKTRLMIDVEVQP